MRNNKPQPSQSKPDKDIDVELLLDRVIIRPVELSDEKRDSGIVITKEMREKYANLPRFGYVVAAGPGDPNRNAGKMSVKKGDLVSFLFYSGTPFEFNGSTHLLMREFDIAFIVK